MIGIYYIENIDNGKKYIGQSIDIFRRYATHMSQLKHNNHVNDHLQNAYNLYGVEKFNLRVLEECKIDELDEQETYWIEYYGFNNLYNLTKQVGSGGGDAVSNRVMLIDLDGKIVQVFESGNKLAKFLGRRQMTYKHINTSSVTKVKGKRYRIVTPDFYTKNWREVQSWPNYTSKTELIKNRYLILMDSDGKFDLHVELPQRYFQKSPSYRAPVKRSPKKRFIKKIMREMNEIDKTIVSRRIIEEHKEFKKFYERLVRCIYEGENIILSDKYTLTVLEY